MTDRALHVVTGALGYTGKAIAERLLAGGVRVRTLTNAIDRANPFGNRLEIHPLDFDRPELLVESLRAADVLYNTYWVRYNHKRFTFEQAVRNSATLFDAARRAGVRRIVHISVLNAERGAALGFPYYAGKTRVEAALRESGLAHSIVRPCLIFGMGDVLINNICWLLRRIPIFGVFGDGQYRLRVVSLKDVAALAVEHGAMRAIAAADALGPETFTFRGMVEMLARRMGLRRAIVPMPPRVGMAIGTALGPLVRDVIITREEIDSLMAGLSDSAAPPTGVQRLADWAKEHGNELGRTFSNDLRRRIGGAVASVNTGTGNGPTKRSSPASEQRGQQPP